jgi:hypothetical protein
MRTAWTAFRGRMPEIASNPGRILRSLAVEFCEFVAIILSSACALLVWWYVKNS